MNRDTQVPDCTSAYTVCHTLIGMVHRHQAQAAALEEASRNSKLALEEAEEMKRRADEDRRGALSQVVRRGCAGLPAELPTTPGRVCLCTT